MSLIITTYVREGIVLASDSRLSISNRERNLLNVIQTDSIRKTFVTKNNVGISTCGAADIIGVPISGYIDSFIRDIVGDQDLKVEEIADLLLDYFRKINPNLQTIFHVAGYDSIIESEENNKHKSENETEVNIGELKVKNSRIQRVFRLFISGNKKFNIILQPNSQGSIFNGYNNTIIKLFNTVLLPQAGNENPIEVKSNGIQYSFFTLQDAIDFNKFAIQTTIDTMKFEFVDKTVGGPIDILVIEPDSSNWIQKKKLH